MLWVYTNISYFTPLLHSNFGIHLHFLHELLMLHCCQMSSSTIPSAFINWHSILWNDFPSFPLTHLFLYKSAYSRIFIVFNVLKSFTIIIYFLMLKISQIWPLRPQFHWSCVLLMGHISWVPPYFLVRQEISDSSPRIRHFPKGPWFLLEDSSIWKSRYGNKLYSLLLERMPLFLGPLGKG